MRSLLVWRADSFDHHDEGFVAVLLLGLELALDCIVVCDGDAVETLPLGIYENNLRVR